MSYVNFKEEIAVAKQQLEKRKINNEKLYIDMIRNKEHIKKYNPDNKYSFKIIYDKFIGKKGIQDEDNFSSIENTDIVCTKFIGCKFYNVKFINCNFIGCTFERCDFSGGGVVFENCNFIKEDSDKNPSLNRKDNFSCHFKKCNLYVEFLNCIMSFIIFESCKIENTYMIQSDMSKVITIDSELKMFMVQDVDLSGAKVVNTYIEDLEFEDKYMSKLDEKTFFDKIPIRKKDRDEYEGLYMVYETLADKFKENSLTNNFGEYYYLCKCIQRKTISKIFPKIESYIYWLTCGYGERPINAVISSLVIIFIFSIIYLFTGIEMDNEIIRYGVSSINGLTVKQFIKDFNESISLSVGMFGGIGCINGKPTEVSYIVSNLEMLIGIAMMGVGIGTLTRKIVR